MPQETVRHYTLAYLAQITGSQLLGNPDYLISGVNDLEKAEAHQASFCENPRYEKLLKTTGAGVVFIAPSATKEKGRNFLINACPSLAFQKVIELFIQAPVSGFPGIHPTAVMHETVELGDGVTIGPHVVIDRGCKIGAHTRIDASVCIGAEVTIGSHCHFYPKVVIREGTQIGEGVIIQPGAVIGSCGFGYFTDAKGEHHSLQQLGIVILEDDVEIGANTTIDRARFKTTRIGRGTKIDNLVQIGHQVSVGEHNLIVAQVGIAGSTTTGRSVIMGGQVGITGHISITDGVILAARCAVSKSLEQPGIYSGIPARPIKECNEQMVHVRSVPKIAKKLKELEAKIEQFEKTKSDLTM